MDNYNITDVALQSAKDILFALCKESGVSGNEGRLFSLCKSLLPQNLDVTTDINGNIITVLGNQNADKTILLDAHIDQIGMRVTGIKDGFLRVANCGGVDARVLQGSYVTIHGKADIKGIVTCTPPHLSNGSEDKATPTDKLWIDTGYTQDEVRQLVDLGDTVTMYSNPKELLNNRVSSVATDNRASVTALILTAIALNECDLNCKVILVFSSREETNALGAKTSAFKFDIDEAISLDVSFAEQPNLKYSTAGKLGGGPMICISSTLNKAISNELIAICKRENIPYQIEVCAGTTGTNADHIVTTKSGVKTALISIPQKNMHTQSEIVDLKDIVSLSGLLSAFIKQGGTKNV